jgi:hypothetical protein
MPAKPTWYAHLPTIRASIESLTETPFLDRRSLQRLFGLGPRQANNLMAKVGGHRSGSSIVISREDLLLRLDRLAEHRGVVTAETQRKARVVDSLDALEPRVRRRVPPPPPLAHKTALPMGVRILVPGKVLVEYATHEEFLSHILGLSQSAVKDFAGFAESLPLPLQRSAAGTEHLVHAPPELLGPSER